MALREEIQNDARQAMKAKEELRSSVLRMLTASLANKEKEKRYGLSQAKPELNEQELTEASYLSEEEVLTVVSSEAKKRKEAISGFEKGGRTESAEKEKKELEILRKYLPEQLTEEEVKRLTIEAIKESGAETVRDMGKVMKELMPKLKGRADGGLVSKMVKDLLGE